MFVLFLSLNDGHSQGYHWRVRCSGFFRKSRRIFCAAGVRDTAMVTGTKSAAATTSAAGAATAAADTGATINLSKNDPLRREHHMSHRRKLVLPLEAVHEERIGGVPDLKYVGLWQYRLVVRKDRRE